MANVVEWEGAAAMILDRTVTLVMPCRNEAAYLPAIVDEVPSFFDEVVIVSNASTDDTFEVGSRLAAADPRLRMIRDDRCAHGIGYGFAHMTGMATATGDVIVCADADGTYPIEDAPRILAAMDACGYRLVSCNRYPDANIPFMLQLGVKVLNIEIRVLYGLRLSDSLSGMWVFHRDVVESLRLTEGDWNLSPQIKLNAQKYLGDGFGEVKVVQRRRLGETKQDYVKTGLRHLWWIARNRFAPSSELQQSD